MEYSYRINYILGVILLIMLSSCIQEDYDNCPDYGKYPVIFIDDDTNLQREDYRVIIKVFEQNKSSHVVTVNYIIRAGERELYSDKTLKLYPGYYTFKAIKSNNILNIKDDLLRMVNGYACLSIDLSEKIKKAPKNQLNMKFKLSNSLIRIACNMDKEAKNLFEIINVEISAPDDSNVFLNTITGKSNYSQEVTEYYDSCHLETEPYIYYYYSVPLVRSKYLNFKFTFKELSTRKVSSIYTRVFLSSDIEQGKVYDFHFDITPQDISYKITTIMDWETLVYDPQIHIN
ncbi:MAG TPA: hypothetical protein P5523_01020 [Bacteroidales bacterium]|nr:hypothetical protein [Bacteroidales bacterium]